FLLQEPSPQRPAAQQTPQQASGRLSQFMGKSLTPAPLPARASPSSLAPSASPLLTSSRSDTSIPGGQPPAASRALSPFASPSAARPASLFPVSPFAASPSASGSANNKAQQP